MTEDAAPGADDDAADESTTDNHASNADGETSAADESPGADANVIERAAVREGHPECPLCGRQLALTPEHLIAFGPDDDPTTATADAVACPVCDGVCFIVE